MARLRDDERFKAVGPDSIVLPYPTPANSQIGLRPESENEGEIWFDWAFVDFWKSNYCRFYFFSFWHYILTHGTDTVQRGFETDPDSLSSSSSTFPLLHLASESRLRSSIAAQNAESTMLVASLREVIRKQAQQIETLEKRLKESSVEGKEVNAVHIFSFFAVPDLGHPSRLSYNHK
jgi:hypothetical protein